MSRPVGMGGGYPTASTRRVLDTAGSQRLVWTSAEAFNAAVGDELHEREAREESRRCRIGWSSTISGASTKRVADATRRRRRGRHVHEAGPGEGCRAGVRVHLARGGVNQ